MSRRIGKNHNRFRCVPKLRGVKEEEEDGDVNHADDFLYPLDPKMRLIDCCITIVLRVIKKEKEVDPKIPEYFVFVQASSS
jgi:hypothetical protein